MIQKETLEQLLNRAQFNGFEFRRWYETEVQPAWPGSEQALALLAGEGRHYTLLFSQEFARCFWKAGSEMRFNVPSMTYSRVNAQGKVVEVTRKPFTRRTIKANVWKYHLSQMAAAEDPVEYISRFLAPQDQDGLEDSDPAPMAAEG
jgi:hypothetical protein